MDFANEGAINKELEVAANGDDEKLVDIARGFYDAASLVLDEVFVGSSGVITEKVLTIIGNFKVIELGKI